MKIEIKKREKILLFVMGLILLLYLAIQFVILPLSTRYNDGYNERARLADEKALHLAEMASMPSYIKGNSDAHDRYKELTDGYPKLAPNEEIDNMLTTLVAKSRLSPTMLRISMGKAPPPPPPPADPTTTKYEDKSAPVEEEEVVESKPIFTNIEVKMNVRGNYMSLVSLIDEIDSIKYIRLMDTGYSARWQDEIIEASDISLAFEIAYLTE